MPLVNKVAFPPPPPTFNSLTAAQRNQLLRSTKKLGRVLGVTPQLLDESDAYGPMHIDLPLHQSKELRQFSTDSVTSSSPSSSRASSPMSNHSRASSPVSLSHHSTTSINAFNTYTEPYRSRHAKARPPLLRLAHTTPAVAPPALSAAVKPSLDTIPASPPSTNPYVTMFSTPEEEDNRFILTPPPTRQRVDSDVDSPTFAIVSIASARMEKMERIRRKLGEEVPVEMVFPPSPTVASEAESTVATVVSVSVEVEEESDSQIPPLSEPQQLRQKEAREKRMRRRVTVHYAEGETPSPILFHPIDLPSSPCHTAHSLDSISESDETSARPSPSSSQSSFTPQSDSLAPPSPQKVLSVHYPSDSNLSRIHEIPNDYVHVLDPDDSDDEVDIDLDVKIKSLIKGFGFRRKKAATS